MLIRMRWKMAVGLILLGELMLVGCDNSAERGSPVTSAETVQAPVEVPRQPMERSSARLDPRAAGGVGADETAADVAAPGVTAEPTGGAASTGSAGGDAATPALVEVPASMAEREPEGQAEDDAAPPVGRPLFTAEGARPLPAPDAGVGAPAAGDADDDEAPSPQLAAAAPDDAVEPADPPSAAPATPADGRIALASPVRLADYSGRNPFPDEGELITAPRPARKVGEAAAPPSGPLEVVPWDEAHRHVGETIIIEGKIVNTYNHNNSIVFLNFDNDWQDKFYVPVFDDAFPGIPGRPETYYKNKTLRVTGKVTVHKGRPNIEVKDPAQIKVVK